jgi:hypothetical protein
MNRGDLIEHGTLILIGAYCTLLGYRVIEVRPKQGMSESRLDGHLRTFRWAGPVIIATNAVLLAARMIQ